MIDLEKIIKFKQRGYGYKWTTLVHNGVLFPSPYIPHKIPLVYNEESIILTDIQEEIAMMYAKYINSEYVENRIFNKNFWNDWKKVLGKEHKIQNLEGCNFTEYYHKLEENKELQKVIIINSEDSINSNLLDTENIMSRINYGISDKEEEKYKTAIVDGKIQPVGNYRMEPPGIFLGRGDNPKLGKVKQRIMPEDVTINIGKDAPVPKTLDGHSWEKIIHDRRVEWLASWKDTITGKIKYLWLGQHSDFKASSDREKFDLARKLKRKIDFIRQENEKNLLNTDIKLRQISTAFYFIDNFALRVGNEKSSDEADTVGVTSLRIEHIELLENNIIVLDFLGKDSVRYYNKLQVDETIYKNIKEFIDGKNKNEDLFDFIVPNDINKYLQEFMKNLTAKVFRTYNASYLFYKELKKISRKYENSTELHLLIDEFTKANAKVAQLCNHQKNVGKSFKGQVEKIDIQLKNIKSKLRKARKSSGETKADRIIKLNEKLNKLKLKKELKQEMKNISLGTSKANYIDPRIIISFSKRHNIPLDKIFTKTLQQKFQWALDVEADFKF